MSLRRSWIGRIAIAVTLLFLVSGMAQADSVASLLGNYSISQFARVNIDNDTVRVHYVVDMAALPALRTLHKADANGDGSTSTAERNTYLQAQVPRFVRQLHLMVDGKRIKLSPKTLTSDLPSEQSGFSLRIDNRFEATLPHTADAKPHRLTFENNNYANQFGWHELMATSGPDITVYDTNAVSTSATNALHVNPQKLPPSGPLNERRMHLAFVRGSAPAGAVALAPRPGHPPGEWADAGANNAAPTIAPLVPGLTGTWLVGAMNRLARTLSAPDLPLSVFLLALLAATVLGALHAFSPGHGKTVVGAYLVGSRGTPRHAAFLGLTVTITHTLGVFILGLATLFASRFFVPEKVFPVLSFASGLLVVTIGAVMFRQRWLAARTAGHGHPHTHSHDGHDHHHHDHDHDHDHSHNHEHGHPHHDHGHSQNHDHDHHHGHDHSHAHDHARHHDHAHHDSGALVHSHGGVEHSHLPPGAEGEKITWGSLLALGISGGLVPCPSALVLLLAAVAVHRIAAGLILVVAFSVGLAVTLTVIGLLFLYARDFFKDSVRSSWMLKVLPVASAALVTAIGALICYGAIVSAV